MTTPPRPGVTLAPMTDDHASAVMAIYQQGIDEGNATFETAAPPWSAFDTSKLAAHRLVALGQRGRVVEAGLRCRVSRPGPRTRGSSSTPCTSVPRRAEPAWGARSWRR